MSFLRDGDLDHHDGHSNNQRNDHRKPKATTHLHPQSSQSQKTTQTANHVLPPLDFGSQTARFQAPPFPVRTLCSLSPSSTKCIDNPNLDPLLPLTISTPMPTFETTVSCPSPRSTKRARMMSPSPTSSCSSSVMLGASCSPALPPLPPPIEATTPPVVAAMSPVSSVPMTAFSPSPPPPMTMTYPRSPSITSVSSLRERSPFAALPPLKIPVSKAPPPPMALAGGHRTAREHTVPVLEFAPLLPHPVAERSARAFGLDGDTRVPRKNPADQDARVLSAIHNLHDALKDVREEMRTVHRRLDEFHRERRLEHKVAMKEMARLREDELANWERDADNEL